MISLLQFRADIPFSKDDTNRFLPWIIAFIVFIAAMMIAFGMGIYGVARANHHLKTNGISIHIPATGNNTDQLAQNVLVMVQKESGVEEASLVDSTQMQQLIKPWLGSTSSLDSLPLPRVINVSFSSTPPDAEALRRKITAIAPDAEVDDHNQWISQYTSMLTAIQWSLWIAALLFMATTLAIVILTTRASIKIHRRVIQILHTIGALDSYIAQQFQYNAFLIAIRGAGGGCAAAFIFYIIACFFTSRLQVPLLPSFRFGIEQFALFLLLPAVVGMGALLSSRLTVLAELRRMP